MRRSLLILAIALTNWLCSAQTITSYTTADGLPSDNVVSIASDASNNMWFGTQAGVAKYDGSEWVVFNTTSHPEMPHNSITAITALSNGNIWIGTDYGASVYDGSTWTTYTSANGLGSNRVKHIYEAQNGDIWISDFKGATQFDGKVFTIFNTTDGLPFGGSEYITETTKGDLLLATALGGLFVYDGSDFKAYSESEGLLSESTSSVAVSPDGDIYVGTDRGLSILDSDYSFVKNYTKMYLMPPPDTLNPVKDVKVDSRGNVWVGIYVDYLSVGGVAMYNGIEWKNYDESNGLAGPTIRKMTLDNNQNLWVGTSKGVSKIESPYLRVEDATNKASVSIYPNPSNGQFVVNLNGIHKQGNLVVVNAQGKKVYSKPFLNQQKVDIEISDEAKGLYFVEITTNFGSSRYKLYLLH